MNLIARAGTLVLILSAIVLGLSNAWVCAYTSSGVVGSSAPSSRIGIWVSPIYVPTTAFSRAVVRVEVRAIPSTCTIALVSVSKSLVSELEEAIASRNASIEALAKRVVESYSLCKGVGIAKCVFSLGRVGNGSLVAVFLCPGQGLREARYVLRIYAPVIPRVNEFAACVAMVVGIALLCLGLWIERFGKP